MAPLAPCDSHPVRMSLSLGCVRQPGGAKVDPIPVPPALVILLAEPSTAVGGSEVVEAQEWVVIHRQIVLEQGQMLRSHPVPGA